MLTILAFLIGAVVGAYLFDQYARVTTPPHKCGGFSSYALPYVSTRYRLKAQSEPQNILYRV